MSTLWFNGWAIPQPWFETQLQGVFACEPLRSASVVPPGLAVAPEASDAREAWIQQQMHNAQGDRWWCGWSMGGLHAVQAAAQDPACQGVIIVAGTPCFMRQAQWPFGLEPAALKDLQTRWRSARDLTLNRFFRLSASGEVDARALVREWRAASGGYSAAQFARLSRALDWLASVDVREPLARLEKPIFFLLGEKDPLLPAAACEALQVLNPRIEVIKLPMAGHAPFWRDGQPALAAALSACFEQVMPDQRHKPSLPAAVSHPLAVQGFDAAAARYAKASGVQQASAHALVSAAPGTAKRARRVLDLGCGTGFLSRAWLNRFGQSVDAMVGIDAAPNMLARAKSSTQDHRLTYSLGALEQPPSDLDDQPYWDLIISNFALHWAQDPATVLHAWCDRLRAGGWLGIALPVQGSLNAIAQAWSAVDTHQHTITFPDWAPLVDRIITALRSEHFTYWRQTLYTEHQTLLEIKRALRRLGATGLRNHGRFGLMTPRQLRRVESAMFSQSANSRGRLCLAYEVGFLWVQKPVL